MQRRRDAEIIDEKIIENKVATTIIDVAIEVHKTLGRAGLLER